MTRRVTPPKQASRGDGEGRILVPASDASQSQSQPLVERLGGFRPTVCSGGSPALVYGELEEMLGRS